MGISLHKKSKEKTDLEKACCSLIQDMLDNYVQYSVEDKQALKDRLNELKVFNETVLDKYDADQKIKEHISKFVDAFNRYFGHQEDDKDK